MDSDLVVGYFGMLDELGEGSAPDITWRVRMVSVWSQITNRRECRTIYLPVAPMKRILLGMFYL